MKITYFLKREVPQKTVLHDHKTFLEVEDVRAKKVILIT